MIAASNEQLGFKTILKTDFDGALEQLAAALKEEGFGILTEIDVQDTMKNKLDIDYPQYRIIGACNPTLAHRALSSHPDMGLLLPCNVTVIESGEGTVEISIIDPLRMMDLVQEPELRPTAEEAHTRLKRVAASL